MPNHSIIRKMNNRIIFASAEEMELYIREKKVDLIDAVFADPLGRWHHCMFAPSQVTAQDINRGFAFDGSSIKLFTTIDTSDMIMRPDPTTCWIDPFRDRTVLHVTCSIVDPEGNLFNRCPRNIAKASVKYMQNLRIADTAYFGPEAEFFLFENVKYCCSTNKVSFEVDAQEGFWNSDASKDGPGSTSCDTNLAYRVPAKQWYLQTPPLDRWVDVRSEMLLTMREIGIPIEKHHHEVASNQHELGYTCCPLVECADIMMCYKYVVKNVAKRRNLSATFMPKPLYGENGSGMHCHQSLWKDGKNLFYDESGKYMKLSQVAMWYIGGLLKHARAVLAFTNSTVNSYKRLVPGFEAPATLVYSKGNRSAAIRVPNYDTNNPKAKRFEFRCPDAAGCVYLVFAAMLMAGLDGIKNRIEPPPPVDIDLYDLPKEKLDLIPATPASLGEALDALREDHQFLLEGGVFSESFVKGYIALKTQEISMCSTIPHPKEYELYYQC
ncbi:putative glutamine synthetase, type I [Cardiosporidium cionae]|uniref:Glutamine synthetase n=1 Tax=Cardiosporidium cionae TaxID=476202 RepID=A0ABQ7JGS7_9APIC|nr:putative glutamine synthetase, type I [Cardiosporidium cionae]|eukprot:KAF8823125.1 putative glutamine synthetase, type I [Cardiosporidium cionae]